MVVLLLVTLLIVTFTGLKVYGTEGHGPLAANNVASVLSTAKADEEDSGESNEAGGMAGTIGGKY